jgi:hypothetical protein
LRQALDIKEEQILEAVADTAQREAENMENILDRNHSLIESARQFEYDWSRQEPNNILKSSTQRSTMTEKILQTKPKLTFKQVVPEFRRDMELVQIAKFIQSLSSQTSSFLHQNEPKESRHSASKPIPMNSAN